MQGPYSSCFDAEPAVHIMQACFKVNGEIFPLEVFLLYARTISWKETN